MRIIQLTSSSAGGVARHARQVAELFAPDHQVILAGPAEVIAHAPVPSRLIDIADRPRASDLTALRELRAVARGADIVHAHGLRAGAAAVIATRGLARRPAVIVTLHNLPVGGRRVQRIAGMLELICARGADRVLGVSGDLVARLTARGAQDAQRALVPAPPRPQTSGIQPAAIRAELGLSNRDPLVVTVARLAPQKGLDLLCDAAALLQQDNRFRDPATGQLRWAVVGDGPLAGELRERVARDRLPIMMLGPRDDVADLMAAADVVVSTSTWEGQPLVVQEALHVGAAIVATAVGGTAEVTGPAAELVAPTGPDISAGITAVLSEESRRTELRRAARQRATRLPGPADMRRQLAEIYDAAHGARSATR